MPRTKRELAVARAASLDSTIATQVALGHRPQIKRTQQIAGVSPEAAKRAVGSTESVLAALEKNGITEKLLDEIGLEGLHAKVTHLIKNKNTGEVIDAIEMPDQFARHRFWRDYNLMIGRLGRNEKTGAVTGGLIVIAPNAPQHETGHVPGCVCETCTDLWEKTARAAAERYERRQQAALLPESTDELDGYERAENGRFASEKENEDA